jgi:hypothetical protein
VRRIAPLLAVLLCASPAAAAMKEAARPAELPPPPDRVFLVGAQVGAMLQDGPAMKTVYSRNNPLQIEVRGTWLFEERFGIGFSGGLQFRRGTGVAPSGKEAAGTSFWQIPVSLEGMLRLALWRDQIAVPFLRFGMTMVAWHEVDEATDPAGLPFGFKFGPHAGGGVQFKLPFPEVDFEGRLSGDSLLDAVYLHVEGSVRSSSNFGAPGLDLSAAGISLGMTLLM